MKNPLKSLLAVTTCLAMGAVLPAAAGQFDGITVEAKLIGGQQYEGLYGRIGQWEASTGATVKIVSKKNHFELDKVFLFDMG